MFRCLCDSQLVLYQKSSSFVTKGLMEATQAPRHTIGPSLLSDPPVAKDLMCILLSGGTSDFFLHYSPIRDSLAAQTVKNLPTVQETQAQSLGGKDPLEKGIATHVSIAAWRIPLRKEPVGLQTVGSQRVGHN